MKQMITIHDVETNEIIEREMTDDEIKSYDQKMMQIQIESSEREKEEIAKAKAKADLLAKLGLTDAEAKLLLS